MNCYFLFLDSHRYGFEKQRCVEALQLLDGDIGSSFEYLYCKCFDLPLLIEVGKDDDDNDDDDSEDDLDTEAKVRMTKEEKLKEKEVSWDEVEEQRREEILALESIYIDEFEVRIPDRLWMFRLELNNLVDMVMNSDKGQEAIKKNRNKENANICKFFKKGACRFGEKCRYKHAVDDPNTNSDSVEKNDKANFELELRFGKDNIYPYEPPIIGFSSLVHGFPYYICLRITECLLKEAQELASNQSPSSFSFIAMLEDDLILAQSIESLPLAFSLPEPESATIPSLRSSLRQQADSFQVEDSFEGKSSENIDERKTEALVRMVEAENRCDQEKEGSTVGTDESEDKPVAVKRTNSRESEKERQISQGEILKQNRRLKDEYQRKLVTFQSFKVLSFLSFKSKHCMEV